MRLIFSSLNVNNNEDMHMRKKRVPTWTTFCEAGMGTNVWHLQSANWAMW
jgi:hypothetical protein